MSCEVWNKEHQLVLNRSRHQVKTRHQEGNNRNWSTFVCKSKDLVCVWSAAVCVSTSHFWPYSSSAPLLSSCFEAFSTWIPELLYSRQPRCYTELHFTVPLRACLVFKMVRRFPFFPPKPQPFIFLLLPADLFLPSIHPSTVAWPQFFFLYAGRFTDRPSSSGRHFKLWSVTSSSDHQKCVSKKHLKCFSSNQSSLWTDQQLQFTFCNKYHVITHTAARGFPSETITDCLQEDQLITIAGKKKKINKSLRNQQPLIFISAILWVDW